jgi:hypothetical protein
LATITEVVPFRVYAPFSVHLPFFNYILEVVFRKGVQHCLQFCLMAEQRPFSFIFNWGNSSKSQGAKSGVLGGWEMTVIFLVKDSVVKMEVSCHDATAFSFVAKVQDEVIVNIYPSPV